MVKRAKKTEDIEDENETTVDEEETVDEDDEDVKKPAKKKTRATTTKKPAAASKKKPAAAKKKKEEEEEEEEEDEEAADGAEADDTTTTATTDFTEPAKSDKQIKIISWNVAGFNACIKKGFRQYLESEDPDIICLQETKMDPSKVPTSAIPDGYERHFIAAEKKGHHGVGLLTKIKPVSVKFGIGIDKHDNEGRVITAEYENFYLVNSYIPNAGTRGLARLDYRTKEWDVDFQAYLNKLKETKPVIWCGDLNVAHNEIDLKNPKTNTRSAGFTIEERTSFGNFLKQGWVDSYRHYFPTKEGVYTFWSHFRNARKTNAGWRLDYFVVPTDFMSNIKSPFVRSNVLGSDHCPIGILVDN
eukprot:gene1556-1974_t